jgi:YidC/Oxa1 family membrane protein insertase
MLLPLANILQPLEDGGEAILVFVHDNVVASWGIAIIVLTFITRLVILPLTLKGLRSMRHMQQYSPQLKALQERYKDDRQRLQREQIEFFRTHEINPFSSCLPFILQIPFFIALFQLLRSDSFQEDLYASSDPGFLFIPDLSEAAEGSVLIVLLVLYFVTTLISFMVSTVSAQGGQQRMIALILPIAFTPLIINFPSGLVVYWITTNVWTIGQQLVVARVMPAPTPPAPEEIKTAKPPPPPPRKRKRRR